MFCVSLQLIVYRTRAQINGTVAGDDVVRCVQKQGTGHESPMPRSKVAGEALDLVAFRNSERRQWRVAKLEARQFDRQCAEQAAAGHRELQGAIAVAQNRRG